MLLLLLLLSAMKKFLSTLVHSYGLDFLAWDFICTFHCAAATAAVLDGLFNEKNFTLIFLNRRRIRQR
jgi:hypothetical protein